MHEDNLDKLTSVQSRSAWVSIRSLILSLVSSKHPQVSDKFPFLDMRHLLLCPIESAPSPSRDGSRSRVQSVQTTTGKEGRPSPGILAG